MRQSKRKSKNTCCCSLAGSSELASYPQQPPHLYQRITMLSSNALRTFARRAASSTTARRFASSGAGAAGAGAETQSAQQTAAYITAGALVVSMACVSQAGQKVRIDTGR